MDFMVFVLYFIAALLALEGIATVLRRRADPNRVRDRLRGLSARISTVKTAEGESILKGSRRLRLPSPRWLELLIYRAGGPITPGRFFILSFVLAAGGYLSVFMLTGDPARAMPTLAAAFVPWLWVRSLAKKRMRMFDEQLPDALELMTRSMRTGHSLVNGFLMVSEELPDPIGTEFGTVAEELRLGLEVRDALENLTRRTGNPELPYFTTAVLIQRQTGGNLAELLDKLSSLLRERHHFAGRVHAMTAQGRGAATFLALWLPFIMGVVWLVAPGYLTPLIENTWGHVAIAGALGVDVLAYYMALRIADVQA